MLREIRELWGWATAPFLGELVSFPEKEEHFIGRKALLIRAEDQLKFQVESCDKSITLICGMPGVGKSTFLDYLIRKNLNGMGERINLISSSDNALLLNAPLEPYQYLDILERIDKYLNSMLNGNYEYNVNPDIRNKYEVYVSNDENIDEFKVLQELARTILVPKCKQLHDMRSEIEHHYIAIDDVDYLCPHSQIQLLSMLCMLANETANPTFIYTARPVAAGVARHSVATLLHHSVTEPIRIPALNPNDVIDRRITGEIKVGIEKPHNPFKDETLQSFIRNISNGNIRVSLEFIKVAQLNASKYINSTHISFTRTQFIEILFGPKVTEKKQLLRDYDAGVQRCLVNIFSGCHNESMPETYIALVAIDRLTSAKTNKEFISTYNAIAFELNPEGMKQKEYSEHEIMECLRYCHRAHLITRKKFDSIEEYLEEKKRNRKSSSLKFTIFELTTSGMEYLMLSRENHYQSIAGFQYLRNSIKKGVQSMSFNLTPALNGEFSVDDINEITE